MRFRRRRLSRAERSATARRADNRRSRRFRPTEDDDGDDDDYLTSGSRISKSATAAEVEVVEASAEWVGDAGPEAAVRAMRAGAGGVAGDGKRLRLRPRPTGKT